jgi:hypothetical protein
MFKSVIFSQGDSTDPSSPAQASINKWQRCSGWLYVQEKREKRSKHIFLELGRIVLISLISPVYIFYVSQGKI